MSEKKQERKIISPFTSFVNASKQTGFDKYYIDRQVVTVFKSTGQKDENGNSLGVAEQKIIDKKVDIRELLESQKDSVGVESYIRALSIQGENINDYGTQVDNSIVDFSNCPDNLADTMLLGDQAKAAFESLDPALKGNHTTIEGFLNSLTKDSVDSYLKAKIEALMPVKKEGD